MLQSLARAVARYGPRLSRNPLYPLAELSTPNANDIYVLQILEEGKAFELGTCLQDSYSSRSVY